MVSLLLILTSSTIVPNILLSLIIFTFWKYFGLQWKQLPWFHCFFFRRFEHIWTQDLMTSGVVFCSFAGRFVTFRVMRCGLISIPLIAVSFSSIPLQNYTWWIMKTAPLMKGTQKKIIPSSSLIFDVSVVTASSARRSLSAGKRTPSCEMALNASPP